MLVALTAVMLAMVLANVLPVLAARGVGGLHHSPV